MDVLTAARFRERSNPLHGRGQPQGESLCKYATARLSENQNSQGVFKELWNPGLPPELLMKERDQFRVVGRTGFSDIGLLGQSSCMFRL